MVVLGVGLVVAAMASLGPAAQGAEPVVVRVGVLGVISDAGVYVAMERGYFQDEGIRVDLQVFGSGAKMIPALVAGELDAAGGTAAAGLYNAIASGMDFKVVADKGQNRPGHEFTTLVVRKDLLDSGAFKSVADLRGRRIALLPGQGVVTQYILGRTLEHAGIPWNGVERVDIAAPNQVTLLANRQVDAAVTAEPFAARAERVGAARRYPMGEEVKALERTQAAVFMYSGKFIAGRRDVARRWMNAYVKGLRFVHEKGIKSDEVIGMLTKHVRATAEDIRASSPPYLAPDGRPDVASLAAQQEWYLKMGMVEKKVPIEKVVDLSFLP
jgi:NitT/TauT family transport system substrate-binding protein